MFIITGRSTPYECNWVLFLHLILLDSFADRQTDKRQTDKMLPFQKKQTENEQNEIWPTKFQKEKTEQKRTTNWNKYKIAETQCSHCVSISGKMALSTIHILKNVRIVIYFYVFFIYEIWHSQHQHTRKPNWIYFNFGSPLMSLPIFFSSQFGLVWFSLVLWKLVNDWSLRVYWAAVDCSSKLP